MGHGKLMEARKTTSRSLFSPSTVYIPRRGFRLSGFAARTFTHWVSPQSLESLSLKSFAEQVLHAMQCARQWLCNCPKGSQVSILAKSLYNMSFSSPIWCHTLLLSRLRINFMEKFRITLKTLRRNTWAPKRLNHQSRMENRSAASGMQQMGWVALKDGVRKKPGTWEVLAKRIPKKVVGKRGRRKKEKRQSDNSPTTV